MQIVGVPYTTKEIHTAAKSAAAQADAIVASLYKDFGSSDANVKPNSKLVALIAYLQRLGKPPVLATPEETKETP